MNRSIQRPDADRSRSRKSNGASHIVILAGLLLASAAVSVGIGSVPVPASRIVSILAGTAGDVPPAWVTIIRDIRLPRILSAAMVGGILAVGGVSCQGIFRNPLSEPYLLGISSGAALGAAIAIVLPAVSVFTPIGVIAPAAFAGAALVTVSVFIAAGRGAFRMPSTLLLSGIAVAFLCQAAIWLLMSLHRDQISRIMFWTMGSLSGCGWNNVRWLVFTTLPVALAMAVSGRILDVLSTGYASAHGLGVRPEFSAAVILGLTALGTASAVAVAGNIGFIGLMVPHVSRLTGGPSHRSLLIRSWFGGAILLVLADLASRSINPPGEIPVGVITSMLGAPFLLVLSRGKHREGRLDG